MTSRPELARQLIEGDGDVAPGLARAELRRQVHGLAALLPAPERASSEVSFAFGHDRTSFAIALLATWQRDHTAALPVDDLRDNVVPVLDREANAAFLHDTGVGRGLFVPRVLREESFEAANGADPTGGAKDAIAVAAFPRGESTNARTWTADELLAAAGEAAVALELGPRDVVACTLTPSEPTALIAGLLAPLVTGARFLSGRCEPEAVPDEATVVVTSHVHARRLATGAPGRRFVAPRRTTSEAAAAAEDALLARGDVLDAAVRDAPSGELLALVTTVDGAAPRDVEHPVVAQTSRLERDANGALPAPLHFLAFGLGRDGAGVSAELEWSAAQRDGRWTFHTRLPERYAYYEGHFPPYPVLAGAVQLQRLVLPCLARTPAAGRAVRRWPNLKFGALIAPGDALEVVLQLTGEPTPTGGSFEVRRGATRCSFGRFELAERAE